MAVAKLIIFRLKIEKITKTAGSKIIRKIIEALESYHLDFS